MNDLPRPNIYQRINAVMQEIRYVQKDKQVSGGGVNYKAVTHDQVVSVARGALVKHGVVIYPEQRASEIVQKRDPNNGIKMHLYSGDYAIHFVNIDDPSDRITSVINAHAADNGDKAPGKCVTYATKTAILKVLCLETGENDESRADIRERSNTIDGEQCSQLAKYCYENTDNGLQWTALGSKLAKAYKIQSIEQLPSSKFDEALGRCVVASTEVEQ